ncbi:hypothetical protein EV203_1521 [Caldanaerobacter subterraneus]|uniref:Uncharacterized protein n=2 Tax=Caldanaerobacter subterraneus TaxID=911092 RepID=A0A4R2JCI2_9THEO|nr:hypothetical protein EV203_1521 [Caldanaerobacter subterraneus]
MSMKEMRERVMEFLKEQLELDKFTLEECHFMPGGVFVKDGEGKSMLVFYDFMKDKVDYWFENEK